MKNPPFSRRSFIKTAAAATGAIAFPTIIPSSALGADGSVAPSNRIVVGCIGTGPQGRGDMSNFLGQKDAQVVAICDVKEDQRGHARNEVNNQYKNQDCVVYKDFRELLARKDIDAVLIATPDHWHVPVGVAAARAGKDMYLEKPMGLTLAEDQILRDAVQKHKRVFQFGTQQRSADNFRLACELVRNRRIGKLQHINVWCSASAPGGSTQPIPVPPGIDYEMWLGPARYTPFTENKCADNNKTWWFNYDYALGFIAGWGVHPLDIAYWGTDSFMSGPYQVEGEVIIPEEGACNTGVAWDVRFKLHDGVTVQYNGTRNGYDKPTKMNDFSGWEKKYGKIADHGTAFEGTDGWVLVDRTGIRTSPESLIETKFAASDVRLMKSYNHVRNFLDGVKTRGKTICPIEDAVQADILCHVSDIATRLKRPLTWDPKAEKFINDADANKRLELRKMREPWTLKA
jgi:predicted dehydrogenase